jgi:cytochrome c-type biogenesis protein CcmF
VLSINRSGIMVPFGENSNEKPGENLTLVKGLRTDMGKYWVTFEKDSIDAKKSTKRFFFLKFQTKDGGEEFYLKPNAYVNEKGQQGLSANPDARHYLTHDVFTYITSLPDPDAKEDTAAFKPVNTKIGDTVYYSRGFMIVDSLYTRTDVPTVDSVVVASVNVQAQTRSNYTLSTYLINKDGVAYPQPDTLQPENLILQLQKADGGNLELGVKESDALMDFVTLKAYKFPWINILWAGTIIMVIGMLISMVKRMERKKLSNKEIRKKAREAVV